MNAFHIVRKKGLLLVCLLILGFALAYGIWSVFKIQSKNAHNKLCNDDEIGALLKSDYPSFTAAQTKDMGPVIERITYTDNHMKGPNCLYVLGRYYMHTGSYTKANTYYDELLRINSAQGLWIDESIASVKPSDIESINNFLKEQSRKAKNQAERDQIPTLGPTQ